MRMMWKSLITIKEVNHDPNRKSYSSRRDSRGSQNKLAMDIHVPTPRINAIVKGSRAITADTALRLGKYFGTGPEFWINLQANYDLCVAAAQSEKEIAAIPQLAPA